VSSRRSRWWRIPPTTWSTTSSWRRPGRGTRSGDPSSGGRRGGGRRSDRDTILGHFRDEYSPARVTVAVAGNAEHARVVDAFAPRFEGFGPARGPRTRAAAPILLPGVHMVSKPLEQVQGGPRAFPACRTRAPERYALYLMNDIMGGSMSSRLFQEVRERQGLVYSVHSGAQQFRDTGVLYLYAGTEAGNFGKVLKGVPARGARAQEGRGDGRRARPREGPPQGQSHALARVVVLPDEPPREAGAAIRDLFTRWTRCWAR